VLSVGKLADPFGFIDNTRLAARCARDAGCFSSKLRLRTTAHDPATP